VIGARPTGGSPHPTEAPRSALLLLVTTLVLGSPLLLQAFGEGPGSFSMFTRPERFRLRILLETPTGNRPLPVAALGPHLGRDARRIILPAAKGFVGETHVSLLRDDLGSLSKLACELAPDARRAHVILERYRVTNELVSIEGVPAECHGAR